MSGKIIVDIGLNTSDIAKGAKDGERALENLERAVSDAGRSSRDLDGIEDSLKDIDSQADRTERAVDDVGRAAEDSGRDGARQLDALEDALRDAQRQSQKTENALDDVGDGGAQGFGKIKDGAGELQQEIGQNLGEAVSSFSGDLTDLSQVGQDTLGGLAATLAGTGPAGIVGAIALAAGAVGWGAITQSLTEQQEAADELRDRLGAAYRGAAEDGRDYLDVAHLTAEANDLLFNPDRADEYKKLREDAKTLHLDESILIKANAGDLQSQAIVQQEINKYLESEDAHLDSIYGKNKSLSDEASSLRDRWNALTDATKEQRNAAANSKRITSEFLLDAAAKAESATREIDEFGNELIQLPDGTEFVIDAKTKQAHQDMDRFYGDADGKIQRLSRKDIRLKLNVDSRNVDRYRPPTLRGTVIYEASTGGAYNSRRQRV